MRNSLETVRQPSRCHVWDVRFAVGELLFVVLAVGHAARAAVFRASIVSPGFSGARNDGANMFLLPRHNSFTVRYLQQYIYSHHFHTPLHHSISAALDRSSRSCFVPRLAARWKSIGLLNTKKQGCCTAQNERHLVATLYKPTARCITYLHVVLYICVSIMP